MKKRSNIFVRLINGLGRLLDKILITPIIKLMLKFMDLVNVIGKWIDRISGNKSFLLIASLLLAFTTFIIIDRESDITIDQYAEILYKQPVTAVYNEELYVI